MQVAFCLAGEITQVIDSIPWVRCASGNVLPSYIFVVGVLVSLSDEVDYCEDYNCEDYHYENYYYENYYCEDHYWGGERRISLLLGL